MVKNRRKKGTIRDRIGTQQGQSGKKQGDAKKNGYMLLDLFLLPGTGEEVCVGRIITGVGFKSTWDKFSTLNDLHWAWTSV